MCMYTLYLSHCIMIWTRNSCNCSELSMIGILLKNDIKKTFIMFDLHFRDIITSNKYKQIKYLAISSNLIRYRDWKGGARLIKILISKKKRKKEKKVMHNLSTNPLPLPPPPPPGLTPMNYMYMISPNQVNQFLFDPLKFVFSGILKISVLSKSTWPCWSINRI